ncbi:MAG: hypothetical protein M1812_004312 [Candelaria pacifica]|nr:MAG: hypothetical protein M1812_004312 [Candelaria pacifica]
MAARLLQSCSIWFWIALFFFTFVIFQRSGTVLPTVGHRRHGPLTVQERFNRSEQAWEDSVKRRHKMRDSYKLPGITPLFPAQVHGNFDDYPYTIWDFFPAVWSCPWDIQRVGRLGDGGKWVCGMSKYEERAGQTLEAQQPNFKPKKNDNATIIYSFGVNDESTFEEEMLERLPNAELFAFDFSVNDFGPQLLPNSRPRAHFMKVGLGAKDEPSKTPPFYTLQSLMAHHKHDYIDIFKIDVEGAEYVAMSAFMDYLKVQGIDTLPIGQIMIELHLQDDENVTTPSVLSWWERLESFGMRPVWLEVNLLAVALGRYVEYVWVNANDVKSVLLDE